MKRNIVSLYHSSFTGGSTNTSRFLNYLSTNGCNVDAYFFEIPQFFTKAKGNVVTHPLGSQNIHSEVIDPHVLHHYCVANSIVEGLTNKTEHILFGEYLFPYCNILHDVKTQLVNLHKGSPRLIIHPVGSDIWQIGPQIKSRVKWLLDSALVDSILTYSTSFADEIKEYYGIEKEIHVLPPVLDNYKFFPIDKEELAARKLVLGFQPDNFIIHHHSSMKKVKCPETVLEIAANVSQVISQECILIMVGPIPYDEIKMLDLNLISLQNNKFFKYKTVVKDLTIYWTGIESAVEYTLQISDVEVNASLHDSFNISLMEAMACGVPVVTSDIVGIRNHIVSSNSGWCFRTVKLNFSDLNNLLRVNNIDKNRLFDIDYAVSAIASIADKRNSSINMGKRGAEYSVNEFSFENASTIFHKYAT